MTNNGKIEKIDSIEIIYKPTEGSKLRIFGKDFIKNNKDKCEIIYENKKYKLTEYFDDIIENYDSKNLISLKLEGITKIINMSFIFCECNSLLSVPEISKWDTSIVKDMSALFDTCTLIKSVPDISE